MDRPLLSVRGLCIDVAGRRLIDRFSCELVPGRFTLLHGPTGCGKTLLLRALALLDDPAAGTMALAGQAADQWLVPHYRAQVCYVHQQPVLLPGTVRDNLTRPFTYGAHRAMPVPDEAQLTESLDRMRLSGQVLNQRITSLSGGEQQRVCLSRALLVQPRVLLLDEPTSALDLDTTLAIEEVLRAYLNQSNTCLLVSHDAAQRERLAGEQITLPCLQNATGGPRP